MPMKILLDTNILISAFVFGGKVRKLLYLMAELEWKICVSEYVEKEFRKKLNEKWVERSEKIYSEYEKLNLIRLESTDKILGSLRDDKDVPVLSDAIFHEVDILLTGDKDFLEFDIDTPLIISPTELLNFIKSREE